MKRTDRIKLMFTRNWNLPGKERLSGWLKPSAETKSALKNSITWLAHEDIAIFTSIDSYIEWSLLSGGTYEEEINKLIRVSLKAGANALDIGANIGLQSIRMAQCAGSSGQVFSFEPLAYLQKKFQRNVSLNRLDNITLFPFALSDQPGEISLQINEYNWNQGTFNLNERQESGTQQTISVRVADQIKEIAALQHLDLVKIDVEGFEFHVIRGLKETLLKFHPRIIFEYDGDYWQRNGQKIGECYQELVNMGYQLYQITPVGCELIIEAAAIKGGNLFCLPKQL